MKKKVMNASEMGKIGGKRRAEKAGASGMAEIGALGRASLKKRDPEFYKRLSQAGIAARKAKKEQEEKEKRSVTKAMTKLLIGG